MPEAWLSEFTPFGLFHAVSVAWTLALIAAWCVVGRRLLDQDRAKGAAHGWHPHALAGDRRWVVAPGREAGFRWWCGVGIGVFMVFATVWRLLPGNYDVGESWPLHLCRVVGLIVPVALMTQWRRPRTLVYFWGLGLSTQALVTPMWGFGLATVEYWLYWVSHAMIVGAGVYDVVVHGWGPRFREWGFAALQGLVFCAAVIPLNLWLGTNYSYLGAGEYAATSLVSYFGPFPDRLVFIIGGGQGAMLVLYGLAVVGRRVRHGRRARADLPGSMIEAGPGAAVMERSA